MNTGKQLVAETSLGGRVFQKVHIHVYDLFLA